MLVRTRFFRYAIPIFFVTISAAQGAQIRDEGHFFSAEGKRDAERQMSDLVRKYNVTVSVETYAQIPADKRAQYEQQGKNAFYLQWMKERAKADGTTGIFILATREPAHLQVGIGRQAIRAGLTPDDRDALRDTLVTHFKSRDYDGGLSAALGLAGQRFNEASHTHATRADNPPAAGSDSRATPASRATPPPATAHHGSFVGSFVTAVLIAAILVLLLFLVVIWLLYRGIRRIFHDGRN